jgi:hypothetical protein
VPSGPKSFRSMLAGERVGQCLSVVKVKVDASRLLVQLAKVVQFFLVLCIRIGFNADPDPALCLKADPDQGNQTNAV